MKTMRSFRIYLSSIFSACLLTFLSGPAQAVVVPYYTHGEIYTRTGYPDYAVIDANSAQGVTAQTVDGGNQWWCDTPNCGVSISPGARGAYGEVTTDPVSGTLGARAGTMAYSAYSGYSEAYGYISQVFRVGSDGSVMPGDLVNLDVGMMLEGIIDNNSMSGQVGGLVTVNYFDADHQYVDGLGNPIDHMPLGTFQDLLFSPDMLDQMPGAVQYYANQNTSVINFSGLDNFDVQVGDLLIVESMIYVSNELGYSDGLNYAWTDFSSTMTSSLTSTTAGATINVVPLPPALYLFLTGMVLMLIRSRKQ